MALFEKTKFEKASNMTKLSVIERYDELKIEMVKSWEGHIKAHVGSTIYGDAMINNILVISHDEHPFMRLKFKNIGAPAGKKNREGFILNNIEDLL